MKGPERIETARLCLRRPDADDAERIFSRYAHDVRVTKFLSWPSHRSIADTHGFLRFSDAEWQRWPAGPYLIESRPGLELVGGTGLGFEAPTVAATGYVLARDAWGRGYATEALNAMVEVARQLRVRHIYALCHPENVRSIRVLEKCGFRREAALKPHAAFPNLESGQLQDAFCYSRSLEPYASACDRELFSKPTHQSSPKRRTRGSDDKQGGK